MRRLASSLLLLALAVPARAGGVALRWDTCDGPANRNFACDRSTGTETLVASFQPPGGVRQFTGMEVIMRITSADGTVPSWWQMFAVGTCRRSSLSSSFDVSDQFGCEDTWTGQGTGFIAKYQVNGSSGVDLALIAAVAAQDARELPSGRTYAAFKLVMNHQRSAGAGACTGCSTPMCIRLEAIKLVQPDPHPVPNQVTHPIYDVLTDGISGLGGSSQVATWQGGTPGCGAGTARPSTWSQLKDRFRGH